MQEGYKKIKVYEKSYAAALSIRKVTKELPETERFGLIDQINRASMSIPLNVAEGYARNDSQKEFKRFLMMAIGSSNEMSVLIDFIRDLGYITEASHDELAEEYSTISRMLNGLIKAVASQI